MEDYEFKGGNEYSQVVLADVKRYDCTSEDSYHCHGCFTMKEQLRGDYVKWEDYEALQAECDTLVEALQAISRNELDAQRAQHVATEALAAHRGHAASDGGMVSSKYSDVVNHEGFYYDVHISACDKCGWVDDLNT